MTPLQLARQIHSKKEDFIAQRERVLSGKITATERKLIEIITQKFITQLTIEKGFIVANDENKRLISLLDKIYTEFLFDSGIKTLTIYVKDTMEVANFNDRYFKIWTEKKKFDKLKTRIRKTNLLSLGLDKNTNLIKGGFLDTFLKDNSPLTEVKGIIQNAIIGGSKVSDLRKSLIETIVTDEKNGLLNKHYRSFAYDTQSKFDRSYAKTWANEVGMTAFQYPKSKVRDSREFCLKRVGEVFLEEEAEEWKKTVNKRGIGTLGENKGKRVTIGAIARNANTYNPITDMGGINCRHKPLYIPNRQALRMDKTLEEVDGKLKRKEK